MTKKLSAVAGILDPQGGLRIVISYPEGFHHHVGCDEILIIVPALWVCEPVPWRAIQFVIDSVQSYVAKWIRTCNDTKTLETTAVKMHRLRYLENLQS